MRLVSKDWSMTLPQPQRLPAPLPLPFFTVESPMIQRVGRCCGARARQLTRIRRYFIILVCFYQVNVWRGRQLHALAEVEARIGRLVVAYVLPGDAEAVLRVL